MENYQEPEDENGARKTGLIIGALALAAVAVVGVLAWMTGSFPDQQPAEEAEPITVEVVATPTPELTSRITPEAAMTDSTPAVAGVSTSVETGPAENALVLAFGLALLGLGGSLVLAKFA